MIKINYLIKEIRDLATQDSNSDVLCLVNEIDDQFSNWTFRRDLAEENITLMSQKVVKLRDALASTQQFFLDAQQSGSASFELIDAKLKRVIEIGHELGSLRFASFRQERVKKSFKDQLVEMFAPRTLERADIKVPEDLAPVGVNLSGLRVPIFGVVLKALLAPNKLGPNERILVSTAIIDNDSKKELEVTIRGTSDQPSPLLPEGFIFPLSDMAAIPEHVVIDLLEYDCLVREAGGKFSVEAIRGKGAIITLKFPLR